MQETKFLELSIILMFATTMSQLHQRLLLALVLGVSAVSLLGLLTPVGKTAFYSKTLNFMLPLSLCATSENQGKLLMNGSQLYKSVHTAIVVINITLIYVYLIRLKPDKLRSYFLMNKIFQLKKGKSKLFDFLTTSPELIQSRLLNICLAMHIFAIGSISQIFSCYLPVESLNLQNY